MLGTSLHRQFFDIDLVPLSGSRFQPTGFADIGPAVFQRPEQRGGTLEWVPSILLESAQSIANWLERTGWDPGLEEPVPALAGLSYVRVVGKDGAYLTSSRTEAHRLASAFVKDSKLNGTPMREVIKERLGLGDDRPLAPRDIAKAVFAMDPLCMVHGVFFAEKADVWPGQPKIARAVTGFVEAIDVREAPSGGVKRDHVRHKNVESGGSGEGYGSIPFHRMEWTAARIVASFCIDLAQIASYGLGEDASGLLATIARWEIRMLMDGGLRLRTACDLGPAAADIVDRAGAPLADRATLEAELRSRVAATAGLLGDGGPITVEWDAKSGKPKRGKKDDPDGDAGGKDED